MVEETAQPSVDTNRKFFVIKLKNCPLPNPVFLVPGVNLVANFGEIGGQRLAM